MAVGVALNSHTACKLWSTRLYLEPDTERQASLTVLPLLKFLDKKTLGEVRQMQGESPPVPLTVFLVPRDKSRPEDTSGTVTVDLEKCNWRSMTVECDVSSMTCATLHVTIREKLATFDGGQAALNQKDSILTHCGKCIAADDETLLEDCGVCSGSCLYMHKRLDWYPKERPVWNSDTKELESKMYGEVINACSAKNGHKSELQSKKEGCGCTLQ